MLERSVARWIRTDAAAMFIVALWAVAATHSSWMWFLILFLAPDLSMVGYVFGPRVGAVTYNSCHVYACPAGLLAASLTYHLPFGTATALSWIAHIAFDNVVGYGLKLPNGFEHTVYGPIGRANARKAGIKAAAGSTGTPT